jgi:hypothetical protein
MSYQLWRRKTRKGGGLWNPGIRALRGLGGVLDSMSVEGEAGGGSLADGMLG